MIKVIIYLLLVLCAVFSMFVVEHLGNMPSWYLQSVLFIRCIFVGVVGGVLYCLRAVYINKCVRKTWDKDWEVWYYLRPIASGISGLVSCIFLKAGLLVLEAASNAEAIPFGYLAIAFIAGYNVDNFVKKLESVALSVWGIGKSRASIDIEQNEQKTDPNQP